jgi:hypothetical protein
MLFGKVMPSTSESLNSLKKIRLRKRLAFKRKSLLASPRARRSNLRSSNQLKDRQNAFLTAAILDPE